MATRLSDSAVFHGQSFQDMIAPLKEYSAAYKEVEKAYDTVSQSTAGIRDLISPERDSATYERYMNYANRLNETVDDFAKGMSMGNRAALLGLKRDYASEIVPINTAIAKRNTLADEQRETRRKNQTAIFQRDANTISLDRFIENPQTDYGGVIYGDNIREDVRKMAKNLAKEISGNPEMRKLFPYAYDIISKKGYNSGEIYKYIMEGANDDERKRILDSLVGRAVAASGVESWNDQNAVRQVGDYAVQGLWDAIGEPDVKQLYDKYNMQLALMDEQARRAATATTTTPEGSGLRLEVRPIYSKEDQDARNNILKNLNNFINEGYIKKDENTGQLSFTKKGLERIEDEKEKLKIDYVPITSDYYLSSSVKKYSPLTVLYNAVQETEGDDDSAKMDNYLRSIGLNPSGEDMLIDLENNFANDIKREISYGMDIDPTNQDDWKEKIADARDNQPISIVKWDKDKGKYVKTNNLDWEEFYKKGKINSIDIAPDSQLIGHILDEKGNRQLIKLPAGTISDDLMGIISKDMDQIQKIKGLFMNDKGEPTEEEIDKRKADYKKYYQQAASALIGGNVQNQTLPQKSEVYGRNVQ